MDPALENILVELLGGPAGQHRRPGRLPARRREDLDLVGQSVGPLGAADLGATVPERRGDEPAPAPGNWRRRGECPGERLLVLGNHDVDHTEALQQAGFAEEAQRRCAATGSRVGCVVCTAARPHGYRCYGRRRFAVSARATVTDRKEVTVSNRPSDDGKSRMLRIVRDVCANVSG